MYSDAAQLAMAVPGILLALICLLLLAVLLVLVWMAKRIWYLPALLEFMIMQSSEIELNIEGQNVPAKEADRMTIEQFLASHPSRRPLFTRARWWIAGAALLAVAVLVISLMT
jgi:hypothetical protein